MNMIALLASEPGRIIGFDPQLLWDLGTQLFNTFLIVLVMYFVLHKPVSQMLEKRKQNIAKEIDEATAQKADAIELKANYEEKLVNIEAEAAEILKEARVKALAREEQIVAAARNEAQEIKAKAEADIKLEEERVKDEIKTQMIDVSTLMASKLVSVSLDEAKQKAIIDEVIEEMGDVAWLN